MQEQNIQGQQILSMQQMSTVSSMIKLTYSGDNTHQIKFAQKQILQNLSLHAQYFEIIITFIRPGYIADQNFKMACCNIIKKYFYQIADQYQIDKKQLLNNVYELMINVEGITSPQKQLLNKGIQFILNKDEKLEYKGAFIRTIALKFENLIQFPEMWTRQTIQIIFGLGNLSLAYMNSLTEPEQLSEFFMQILPIIGMITSISLKFCQSMFDNNERRQQINHIFKGSQILYELLEIAIERLFEEEQIIPQEVKQIKNSEILFNLLIQHLYAFGQQKSMISSLPRLNQIKQSILQILYIMNMNILGAIPKPILDIIFMTFITESLEIRTKKRGQDDHSEQIICRCMEIVQYQLRAGINTNFFKDYKVDILFAIMIYSKTTVAQLEHVDDSPQKFIQMAQQFTEAFSKSPIIKVRAANMLNAFIKNFDEGVKNLMELIIIFITGSLSSDDNQTDIFKKIKQEFSQYDFWGLTNYQKLDIAFMLLCVIAPEVYQREELYKVVTAILLSQLNNFIKINDKVVITRLIRLIGYYPNSIYFAFIRALMQRQKIFAIQAIRTFERICKNQQFMKVFPQMGLVFIEIIDFIEITDSIFEQLVLNNYDSLLKKNQKLYQKVVNKLTNDFLENIGNKQSSSKQKIIVSMNYFSKLMKRQKSLNISELLQKNFLMIQSYGKNIPLLQDSLIDIYEIIVDKYVIIDHRVLQFVIQFGSDQKLNNYSAATNYFRLINKVLQKCDNHQFIYQIYVNLIQYLLFTRKQVNESILKYLCFSIGYIVITQKQIVIEANTLQAISKKILQKNNQSIQYIFILCHILYNRPEQTRQCLIVKDLYYSVILAIFQKYYRSKLQRKVVILALQQLLTYQPEIKLGKEIVKFCLNVLSEQKKVYQKKSKKSVDKKQKKAVEMRRLLGQDERNILDNEQEQNSGFRRYEIQEQQISDQNLKEDEQTFKDLKHPFLEMDEFQCFRQRLGTLNNGEIVGERDREQLRKILQSAWHNDRVRKIVRVNQQF